MKLRLALLVVLFLVPILLQLTGVVDFFDLQLLKNNQQIAMAYTRENPLITVVVFIAVYTVVCALPLPAVALLTVMAGMLFGFAPGLLIVSFASAIGATLAFWLSRYIGQDLVHRLMGRRITSVDLELNRAGFLYATSLRLLPGVPFFVANVSLGLTTMKTSTFYLSTQLGMLVMLSILVNAGHNLSNINALEDIFSTRMMLALALLAAVPIVIRLISKRVRSQAA